MSDRNPVVEGFEPIPETTIFRCPSKPDTLPQPPTTEASRLLHWSGQSPLQPCSTRVEEYVIAPNPLCPLPVPPQGGGNIREAAENRWVRRTICGRSTCAEEEAGYFFAMATFIARVELHDATAADYDKLYEVMAKDGFTKTVHSDDGTYNLPTGTYRLVKETTSEAASALASSAAASTGRRSALYVAQVSGERIRLEKTQPAPPKSFPGM